MGEGVSGEGEWVGLYPQSILNYFRKILTSRGIVGMMAMSCEYFIVVK